MLKSGKRKAESGKRKAESGNLALDSGRSPLAAPSGALRVVSGNPWFPKIAEFVESDGLRGQALILDI